MTVTCHFLKWIVTMEGMEHSNRATLHWSLHRTWFASILIRGGIPQREQCSVQLSSWIGVRDHMKYLQPFLRSPPESRYFAVLLFCCGNSKFVKGRRKRPKTEKSYNNNNNTNTNNNVFKRSVVIKKCRQYLIIQSRSIRVFDSTGVKGYWLFFKPFLTGSLKNLFFLFKEMGNVFSHDFFFYILYFIFYFILYFFIWLMAMTFSVIFALSYASVIVSGFLTAI